MGRGTVCSPTRAAQIQNGIDMDTTNVIFLGVTALALLWLTRHEIARMKDQSRSEVKVRVVEDLDDARRARQNRKR